MQLKRIKTADVYPSEGNPREDMGDLEALAASFELNPVHPGEPLNPPLVVQDGGVYRIVDGERRWRAMRKAGTAEFGAVVCEDWADADAALAMLATDDKKPLDEVERSRGVQRALLLGVEPRKVEKAARRKGLRRVKRAAERLGAEAELMSLDHLMAVDELADHPELAGQVASAGEGTWERVYKDAKRQVEGERAAQALRDKAAELRLDLEEGAERPEGMSYAATCRTPDDLEAVAEEYAGGALYALKPGNEWNGPSVIVYTALPDEGADPALEAAKEARDAMCESIADMLHSVRAHLVPKVMGIGAMPPRESMAAAVELWLGDEGSDWSERGKVGRFLDQAEWEGIREDGRPDGLVGAAILRGWLIDAEPGADAVGMVCGVDEMTDYGRERVCALLDCLGAAVADGWRPNDGDKALMAELSAACKQDEEEE